MSRAGRSRPASEGPLPTGRPFVRRGAAAVLAVLASGSAGCAGGAADAPLPVPTDWRVATLPAPVLGGEYHDLKRRLPGAAFAPGVGLAVAGGDTVRLGFEARGERLAPPHESLTLETAPAVVAIEQRRLSAADAPAASSRWVEAITRQSGVPPTCTREDTAGGPTLRWRWAAADGRTVAIVWAPAADGAMDVRLVVGTAVTAADLGVGSAEAPIGCDGLTPGA